jgi:acetylornithine/N-succinyldiaminopimelate aminotransferase
MGLEVLAHRFDFIREIRGEGLIIGIDLSIDGAPFVAEALRQGLLINCTHDRIIRLLPPFIIKQRDVAEFLHKFEMVLARASKAAAKSAAATPAAVKSESRSQPLALAVAR